jgi:hypothetical protein
VAARPVRLSAPSCNVSFIFLLCFSSSFDYSPPRRSSEANMRRMTMPARLQRIGGAASVSSSYSSLVLPSGRCCRFTLGQQRGLRQPFALFSTTARAPAKPAARPRVTRPPPPPSAPSAAQPHPPTQRENRGRPSTQRTTTAASPQRKPSTQDVQQTAQRIKHAGSAPTHFRCSNCVRGTG